MYIISGLEPCKKSQHMHACMFSRGNWNSVYKPVAFSKCRYYTINYIDLNKCRLCCSQCTFTLSSCDSCEESIHSLHSQNKLKAVMYAQLDSVIGPRQDICKHFYSLFTDCWKLCTFSFEMVYIIMLLTCADYVTNFISCVIYYDIYWWYLCASSISA